MTNITNTSLTGDKLKQLQTFCCLSSTIADDNANKNQEVNETIF